MKNSNYIWGRTGMQKEVWSGAKICAWPPSEPSYAPKKEYYGSQNILNFKNDIGSFKFKKNYT